MTGLWIGLAVIPGIVFLGLLFSAACAGVALLWQFTRGASANIGQKVYAYQVTSIAQDSQMRADKLLGSVIVEYRNLGPTRRYRIEHGVSDSCTLGADRLPGYGRWTGNGRVVEWNDKALEAMKPPSMAKHQDA